MYKRQVEGLVYDAHRSFNFDCHYEQGLMRFKKDELAIFNPDGKMCIRDSYESDEVFCSGFAGVVCCM